MEISAYSQIGLGCYHPSAPIYLKASAPDKLTRDSTLFFIEHFKNRWFWDPRSLTERDTEVWRELKALPEAALKALLGSDQLPVEREEIALYAVIMWVKENVKTAEEIQETMARLVPFIRFPFMKADVLGGLIDHPDLPGPACQELVIEGLRLRTEMDDTKLRFRSEVAVGHRRFERREAYLKPVKVMVLEQPQKAATVNLNCRLEELEAKMSLTFETFRLCGASFSFRVRKVPTTSPSSGERIGLDLVMCTKPAGRVVVELHISAWSEQHSAFIHRSTIKDTFQGVFQANTLAIPCTDLFGKDVLKLTNERNQWVVGGQLFILAELVIKL